MWDPCVLATFQLAKLSRQALTCPRLGKKRSFSGPREKVPRESSSLTSAVWKTCAQRSTTVSWDSCSGTFQRHKSPLGYHWLSIIHFPAINQRDLEFPNPSNQGRDLRAREGSSWFLFTKGLRTYHPLICLLLSVLTFLLWSQLRLCTHTSTPTP